jgi:hypothetical protein
MRGTASFPFHPGQHKRIAVKVIDFRRTRWCESWNWMEGNTDEV